MALLFVCITCARDFRSSERFVRTSGGQCPRCLRDHGLPRICAGCNNPYVWFEGFARMVGHAPHARMLCPTCSDAAMKLANPEQPVVTERMLLHFFPAVRILLEMEDALPCDPQGKAEEGRVPARRRILRDRAGKSYDGRLDLYDFRPDGARGVGSVAQVRVMRVTHAQPQRITVASGAPLGQKHEETVEFDPTYDYLVLEPARTDLQADPPVTLQAVTYRGKSAAKGGKPADGGVQDDSSYWSHTLTSCSRTGAHWGGTVVAITDDDHPLLVRQDNNLWRYGRMDAVLEEPGFREGGVARLSVFLPGAEAELVESLVAQDVRAKLTREGVVARPNRMADGYRLPDGLPGGYELRIESVEAGGGYSNTGWAQIVCGAEGQPLRPYATAGHRGDLACGQHGWFSEIRSLATVQATWWNKADQPLEVEICLHTVTEDGGLAQLHSEVLFRGVPEALPTELSRLAPAVKAAASKVHSYHCRHLCYVAVE